MIISFLIDTSASMNQVTSNGLTLLDCAKSAVEHFVKHRGRDPNFRNDRYFLVTCAKNYSDAVRIGWDRCVNFQAFMEELKNLSAHDLSDIGRALRHSFELINSYRLQTGIDSYGQGQNPWFHDTAMCIVITDATVFTTPDGVQEDLVVPTCSYPGSDLTIEPFRWDQRVFTIHLNLSAGSNRNVAPFDQASKYPYALKGMCDVTGGSIFLPMSLRGVLQSVDQILGKARKAGVLVNFQADVSMDGEEFPATRSLLPVRGQKEYLWPIAEPYWVDRNLSSLPSRPAQPTLIFQRTGESAADAAATKMVLEVLSFPCDTYVLDTSCNPTPPRGQRWSVYIRGSHGENSLGDPIGFLRTVSTNGTNNTVMLTLLPYNYPVLFKLLVEAARHLESSGHAPKQGHPWVFQPKVLPSVWRQNFSTYLSRLPGYYWPPLKKGLKRFNLHTLIQDIADGGRSYQVSSYLKRLRDSSKAETDRQMVKDDDKSTRSTGSKMKLLKKDLLTTFSHSARRAAFWAGDMARLTPTRRAFEEDAKHAIPILEMGSYQPILLQKEALRDPLGDPEPDEDTPAGLRRRQLQVHFGNPYRRNSSKQSDADDGEAADEAAILRGQSPRRQRSKNRASRRKGRSRTHSPNSSPVRMSPTSSPDRNGEFSGTAVKKLFQRIESNSSAMRKITKRILAAEPLSDKDMDTISEALSNLNGGPNVAAAYRRQTLYLCRQFKRQKAINVLV